MVETREDLRAARGLHAILWLPQNLVDIMECATQVQCYTCISMGRLARGPTRDDSCCGELSQCVKRQGN
jgi:hypothetical protein